jgi:hypothetical protein
VLPMKKKAIKRRNPFSSLARRRRAGLIKNKNQKRLNGNNKQKKYLEEDY